MDVISIASTGDSAEETQSGEKPAGTFSDDRIDHAKHDVDDLKDDENILGWILELLYDDSYRTLIPDDGPVVRRPAMWSHMTSTSVCLLIAIDRYLVTMRPFTATRFTMRRTLKQMICRLLVSTISVVPAPMEFR